MPTTKALVKEVIPINESTNEYILLPEKYSRFESGQFLQLAFGEINNYEIWPDSRAFSIASPYDKNKKELRIIVKKGQSFTRKIIESLKKGDSVTIRYPLGDFYIEEDGVKNLVFIAGGTGITPFLSYIGSENEKRFEGKIFLFYSAKNICDLIHKEQLLNYAKTNDRFYLQMHITRDEQNDINFKSNRINSNEIINVVNNPLETKFYICGPVDFIESITKQLKEEEIKNIYSEIWD